MEQLINKIGFVDPIDFDKVFEKLYNFFKHKKKYRLAHGQSIVTIMAACEDPKTLATFNYGPKYRVDCNGQNCEPSEESEGRPLTWPGEADLHPRSAKPTEDAWPLPQTTQMLLEVMMMDCPDENGFFSMCTSYRNEPNPIPGRHNLVFPLLDFETKGNMRDLINMERDLLEHLGYGDGDSFKEITYDKACMLYGVNELEHEHERQLCKDFGPVVFLTDFPNRTSPFWNMKQHESQTHAYKVDVILDGQETIGSAQRSNDVEEMKRMFQTISDGDYAGILYSKFSKERVDQELENFYSLKFMDRCGGGIGITRLIRSMKIQGLLD